MNDVNRKFRRAWITAGQGELWNCGGTYCQVPYEILPRVNRASDGLEWLDCISPELHQIILDTSTLNSSDNQIANIQEIVTKAKTLRLDLPRSFLSFMGNVSLQEKVPTCTACFLSLSEDFVPIPETDGHFLLRFLNDSQACVLWYLWLNPQGEVGVVASDYFLDPDIFEVMEYPEVKREELFNEALLCADGFVEFLYRFWVENTIWYSLQERLPLTPIQEEYRKQITKRL